METELFDNFLTTISRGLECCIPKIGFNRWLEFKINPRYSHLFGIVDRLIIDAILMVGCVQSCPVPNISQLRRGHQLCFTKLCRSGCQIVDLRFNFLPTLPVGGLCHSGNVDRIRPFWLEFPISTASSECCCTGTFYDYRHQPNLPSQIYRQKLFFTVSKIFQSPN